MTSTLQSPVLALLLTLCICSVEIGASAQTLQVKTNGNTFMPGDTIRLEARIEEWRGSRQIASLFVWIEDVEHKMMWKLRYPVLAGMTIAFIALPENLPQKQYAMYCQLNQEFFGLEGTLEKGIKTDSLSYVLLLQDSTSSLFNGTIAVNAQGKFKIPRHMFPDKAVIFFSVPKKRKSDNSISLTIKTPLDSLFKPLRDTLLFFQVGENVATILPEDYLKNKTIVLNTENMGTLENVTVVGKMKTPVEKFDETYSNGFFQGGVAQIFSGLDGEFAGFINILDYLTGRVAGLRIQQNGTNYEITWRGDRTDIFLDEMPVDAQTLRAIPPSDVAMVKIFQPPFAGSFLGGSGGAIAVYTKRGGDGSNTSIFKNRFVIKGYTPLEFTLKPNAL